MERETTPPMDIMEINSANEDFDDATIVTVKEEYPEVII